MDDEAKFLNSIPSFLRRLREPMPTGTRVPAAAAAPRRLAVLPALPGGAIHGGQPPVQPRFAAPALEIPAPSAAEAPVDPVAPEADAEPAPGTLRWLLRKKATAMSAGGPGVVDLDAHRAGAAEPAPAHSMQDDVRAAFGLKSQEFQDHQDADEAGDDDVAFQVTLPRGVIRQIRVLAAADGTSHRALVLRALRAAGLAVPDGADVDRRALAAKRRQQA